VVNTENWNPAQKAKLGTIQGLTDYLLVESTLNRIQDEIRDMKNPDELDSILDSGLDTCREVIESALQEIGKLSSGVCTLDPGVLKPEVLAILSVTKGVHVTNLYEDTTEEHLKVFRYDNRVFLVFEVPSQIEQRMIRRLVRERWNHLDLNPVEIIEDLTSFVPEVIVPFLEYQPDKFERILEDEGVFDEFIDNLAGSNTLQHVLRTLDYKLRFPDEVIRVFKFKEMHGARDYKVYEFERPKPKVVEEEEEEEDDN